MINPIKYSCHTSPGSLHAHIYVYYYNLYRVSHSNKVHIIFSLFPIPYSLLPTPYSLLPTPYSH
ncbi:MAG: hypothetical protein F6J94_23110 [Moorea sp. SIO1F2]|uniref:hypothetical protein n=1 Tax=unclassified Moorena TaxID=2683338 RepID=UPI0013BABAE7|nr:MULTISPECIES: hypothetical protein [unclassified Moorena]NEO06566.1 hypothetical protein [Moorena sp. SIO3I8]NEO19995.1 hypothetical protein [Moorena sp. SIO4A5]NEP23302.1 hypothetical protein [Moorena sp. SIO3I6]NEQ59430.1 hypothetical protein [Moorena sp. SIO4A1]NET84698.1 hypothetical protein [Moorena sp. SIO1F2]